MARILFGLLVFCAAAGVSAASAQQSFRIEVPAKDFEEWKVKIAEHIATHLRSAAPALSKAYEDVGDIGPEGSQVVVRLVIEASGQVSSATVAKTSGHLALDEVAVQAARRASPFPSIAPGSAATTLTYLQPVTFNPRRKPSVKP